MKLGNKSIGIGEKPFIIAEMSGNHNQSLEKALQIVGAAAKAGADALKIQTYTADTMTLNLRYGEFVVNDPKSLWNGRTLHDLYQEAHTPWEWHQPIFDRCKELGIYGFSTPFDATAVDFLETLNVPFYKIASFELIDLPLIKRVAETHKPMIMSTGMASLGEIEDAVQVARNSGCSDLVLLKCTSTYPATPDNTNILTIPHMRNLFGTEVGLSDHTLGIGVAVASVALGATVIEKHFTLDRSEGGVDSAFSLEPFEMASLVSETNSAQKALGSIQYGPTLKEKSSLQFRRSVYVTEDVLPGEILTEKNIRVIRPGNGLAPKFFPMLLGRTVRTEMKKGTPLSWNQLI